jgi:oligogalacturonide transport system permease protein
MLKKRNKTAKQLMDYGVIFVIGVILLYPIIWMFFSTFKSNDEIFGSIRLLPKSLSLDYYTEGWKGNGKVSYTQFFVNTFLLVLPTTVLTVISSALVAYGFARFRFPGKRVLFAILIATLMLPNSVIIIPRYALYNKFHWINTYLPFYAPAVLACYPFFTYMLIQFLRGLPKELDESAYIDGCGTFRTFMQVLLPLMKPALFSAGLFQFLWTYNDYFNSLIFINSVKKFPISLALRMSLDAESVVQWGKVMAMAFVAVIPVMLLFFAAQKYFVEGIATSGIKG